MCFWMAVAFAFSLEVWQPEWGMDGSEYAIMRAAAVKSLVDFWDTCRHARAPVGPPGGLPPGPPGGLPPDASGHRVHWQLTPQEVQVAREAGYRHLKCYQYLAAAADARQEINYSCRPKRHAFWHILRGSPSF